MPQLLRLKRINRLLRFTFWKSRNNVVTSGTSLLPILPASSLRGCWWVADVTVLHPGWVLEVGHAAESRTAHFTSVLGEPVGKVKRCSQLGSLGACSAVRLLRGQTPAEAHQGCRGGKRPEKSEDHFFNLDRLAWLMNLQTGIGHQIYCQ